MITKPTLLLDIKKCKTNISNMFARATEFNVELRPHFKTHQSIEIGNWFKDVGVSKITVSSLEMANYFAEQWDDITVAFPVNILEIDTINRLAKKNKLNLLIESEEAIQFLNKNLKHPVNYFIKINIGNNRAGIIFDDVMAIETILNASKPSRTLKFIGFLGHAGQTYSCKNKAEVLKTHRDAKAKLITLKQKFTALYPNIIISYGDTPSCSLAEDFSGIDEIRPGNYVFYDVMQCQIGSCSIHQIAVAMACPIVAIHKGQNEIIVYGGGIHLSKERIKNDKGDIIYGYLAKSEKKGWGHLIPNTYVKRLSQEHGVISIPEALISNYTIGDYLIILPVHSCMTANLMKSYLSLDGKKTVMFNSTI